MEIIRSKTAGFCFGVQNAVKKSFETAEMHYNNIYTYGDLIHNNAVIERLKQKGIKIIENLDDPSFGNACVIIRTHGVAPEVFEGLRDRNCKIIDATCPFVTKIHKLVQNKYENGFKIIIIGDKDHCEVIGINGWCKGSAIVIDTIEEALSLEDKGYEYCSVSQTTFDCEKWQKIINILKNKFDKFVYFDTICSATTLRQQDARKLAACVELMVVVGDKKSSNTLKLFEISKSLCQRVLWVESSDELDAIYIKQFNKVGVTAGASTPDWIIEEVIGKMSDLNSNESNDFAAMLEESLTKITGGQLVKGPITKIDTKGVFIDIGFKFEGFIPIDEFTDVPGFDMSQIKMGVIIEAIVVKVSDKDGEATLSKRKVDYKKNMILIEQSFKNKTPISVNITEATKGGVVAFVGSVRIFIPASQLGERYVKDINTYVGTTVDVLITNVEQGDRGRLRIIGSQKVLLNVGKKEREEEFWSDMYVGKICTGTVKSLTGFGAFVDIGGVDGLIHLSELSWKRIKNATEVLTVGQVVEVTVIDIDKEKSRISLGYRKSDENPWFDAENKYKVGDILEVTILRFVSFGVFVKISDTIDGLVHISQISNVRIIKASDVLKIGQKVQAKIIEANIAEKKINLSIKEVQAYDPENSYIEDDAEKPAVKEKVAKPVNVQEKSQTEYVEQSSNTIGDILSMKVDSSDN